MTTVLVEGESDRIVLEVLAARLGVEMDVVAIGGAQAARRVASERAGERILGLVDAAERREFERALDEVFVCDRDLEDELIRALGVDAVLAIIDDQGEAASFGVLQRQPAQRDRAIADQLRRFLGGRSGNKSRYARLFADALPLDAVPAPLAALLRSAAS